MIKRKPDFDKFFLDNITLHICCLNALAMICEYVGLGVYERLVFVPQLVFSGEIWRVFTFLFVPGYGNLFFALLFLYVYFTLGSALEHNWGKSKYNLYLLISALSIVAAGLITGYPLTNGYIFSSIFLAFAYLWPNEEFLLFFFLPVKAKWLAWLDLFGYAVSFLLGGLASKIVILAALLPMAIFFGKDIFLRIKAYIRRQRYGHRK